MQNYSKISFLFAILALSSCHSRRVTEVSGYTAQDSIAVQTDLKVYSLTNIEKSESISSCSSHGSMYFDDGRGEIKIYPNGEVTIKGLKRAHLIAEERHELKAAKEVVNDTLTVNSHSKAAAATSFDIKADKTITADCFMGIKILRLIPTAIIILLILSILYLKKLWLKSTK